MKDKDEIVLRYMAPTACGEDYRKELIRRSWEPKCWVCGAPVTKGSTVCEFGVHRGRPTGDMERP